MATTPATSVAMLARVSWLATYDGTPTVRRLPVKDRTESIVIRFDFSAASAAVSNPAIGVFVDRSPGSMADTSLALLATVSPTDAAQILVRVSGGLQLVDYGIRCTVASDQGDTLVLTAVLPVRALPGYAAQQALDTWDDTLVWDDTAIWLEPPAPAVTAWNESSAWIDACTWND